MPVYKYQPYYQYSGPTYEEPFRKELSTEESDSNRESFFNEIEIYFDDVTATFERASDNFIHIISDITQQDCDKRVRGCLNSLDLYAKRIPAI